MNEVASILAIGDVHLGTACSGLPEEISAWGVDPSDLTPAVALRSAVSFAIDAQVDAVLFAGDVVESTNARFEAMLPLEEGVQRLLDAGIEVIAVANVQDLIKYAGFDSRYREPIARVREYASQYEA